MTELLYVPRKYVRSYRAKGYEPVPGVRRDWAVLMQFVGVPTQEPVEKTYRSNASRARMVRLPLEYSQTPSALRQKRYRDRKLAEARG